MNEATFEHNKENVNKGYRYICEVLNTAKLYIFTEGDKCHQIKALSVPIGRYNDKGVAPEQVSGLTMGEETICIISDYKPKGKLLFVIKGGFVKRVPLSEFATSRKP